MFAREKMLLNGNTRIYVRVWVRIEVRLYIRNGVWCEEKKSGVVSRRISQY